MLQKVEGKRGRGILKWMDSITVTTGAPLEDLKDQVRDNLSWKTFVHMVAKKWH